MEGKGVWGPDALDDGAGVHVEQEGLEVGRAALHSPGPANWPYPSPIEPLLPNCPPFIPQTPADTGHRSGGCRGPEPLAFDTGD